MSFVLEFHEDACRVIATALSADDGRSFTDHASQAVGRRPELAHWDWIIDVRERLPRSAPLEIPRLAALMDRSESCSHSVVVTTDTAAEAWVRVLNAMFRARRHWVASSIPAAMRLLDAKGSPQL